MRKKHFTAHFLVFLLWFILPIFNSSQQTCPFSYPVPDDTTTIQGPKGYNFCFNNLTTSVTINPTTDIITNGAANVNSTAISLTNSGSINQASTAFYDTPINIDNGFVTQFTLSINNPTCITTYNYSNSSSSSGYSTQRCGGEGVAFLIYQGSPYMVGAPGGGLGYANLPNVLAVEFDTTYEQNYNDPSGSLERHISVIINSGIATANEQYHIVRNSAPINFKNNMTQNFISNPVIKIQYLNNNLRVVINGVLQAAYYWPLNIKCALNTTNNQFYIGFSGSTGLLTQDQFISGWLLWLTQSSADASYATFLTPLTNIITTQLVQFYVQITDRCSNPYSITDPSGLMLDSSFSTCTLQNITASLGTIGGFIASLNCQTSGQNVAMFRWNERQLSNNTILFNVTAGSVTSANITMISGTQGEVDQVFTFLVTPLDVFGNPTVPSSNFSNNIQVTWPTLFPTNPNLVTVNQTGSLFTVTVNADKPGVYTIQVLTPSGLISNSFEMDYGLPSPVASNAIVAYSNYSSLNGYTFTAGTTLKLLVTVADSKGNVLPISLYNTQSIYVSQNASGNITLYFNGTYDGQYVVFNVTPTTSGINTFVAYLNGVPMSVYPSQISVTASNFAGIQVNGWDINLQAYLGPTGSLITMFRSGFYLQVVEVDIYGNYRNFNTNYSVTMSGNLMTPLTLCGVQPGPSSVIYSVCNNTNDINNLNFLVARPNYTLIISNVATNQTWSYVVNLITMDDDSDAGNGPFIPASSIFYFWYSNQPNPVQATNTFNDLSNNIIFGLILINAEGKRCNQHFLPESNIYLTTNLGNASLESYNVTKFAGKRGYYMIYYNSQKPGTLRNFSILFDGSYINQTTLQGLTQPVISQSIPLKNYSIPTSLKFIITASAPSMGYIIDNSTNSSMATTNFNTKGNFTVDNIFNFSVDLKDKFLNPSYVSTGYLDIGAYHNTISNLVVKPNCTQHITITGRYVCSTYFRVSGNYTLKSLYFGNISYTVTINPGIPQIKFTNSTLDLSVNSWIPSTQSINFLFTPHDQYGNFIPGSQVIQMNLFGLGYKLPNSNQMINVTSQPTISSDGNSLVYTIQLNQIGTTTFFPTMKGSSLRCTSCSITVRLSSIVFYNTIISMLSGSNWITVNPTSGVKLDNTRILPSFYIQLVDLGNNIYTYIPNSWSNFTITLTQPYADENNYTLIGQPYNQGISFNLNPNLAADYASRVYSQAWTMTLLALNGSTVQSLVINNVTMLGDQSGDAMFDNGQISLNYSGPNINTITVTAGVSSNFTLEIRTIRNKLLKYWYPIPSTSILFPNSSLNVTSITLGNTFGRYFIYFNNTIAGNYSIQISINNSNTFTPLINNLTLIVLPSIINSVTITNVSTFLGFNTQNFVSQSVDTPLLFTVVGRDSFFNPISTLQATNLQMVIQPNTNNSNCQIVVTAISGGAFGCKISCQKVTNVTLTSFKFYDLDRKNYIPNYFIYFGSGNPSIVTSYSTLNTTSVLAGSWVTFMIYPKDQFGNSIDLKTIDITRFSVSVVFPSSLSPTVLTNIQMDPTYTYIMWTIQLTQSGISTFQGYFDNYKIIGTNNIITVSPLQPDFYNTTIYMKNPLTGGWLNQSSLTLDISNIPSFMIQMSDDWNNIISIPPATWNLSLTLSNPTLLDYPIIFCWDGITNFYMCPNNSAQPYYDPPAQRWLSIVPGVYELNLATQTQSLTYNLNLTSTNANDYNASDGPINVQLTYISPAGIITMTAGTTIQFTIEIRTDANIRKKIIFDNITSDIRAQLSQNDDEESRTIQINPGGLIGQYNVYLTVFKTYQASNPNTITFFIQDEQVLTTVPQIIVNPTSIAFANITSQLGNSTPDTPFTFIVSAWDQYENNVPLSISPLPINILILDPMNNTQHFNSSLIQNNDIQVSFQPIIVGQYEIIIQNTNIYQFSISNGQPSSTNSFVNISTQNTMANQLVNIYIYTEDKYGNSVPLDSNNLQEFRLFFNDAFGNTYQLTSYSTNGINILNYPAIFNTTGMFTILATYMNQSITCKVCSISVQPAVVNFSQSQMYYYDTYSMSYSLMPTKPLVESNLYTLPQYKLILSDSWGNLIPYTNNTNITAELSGNGIIPLVYLVNENADGSYTIQVDNEDSEIYEQLLYETTPYTLTISDTISGGQITFPILIQGSGSSDIDADNSALNISLTDITPTFLTIHAGSSSQFFIEARTINNLRKNNLSSNNSNITITFSTYDPSNNYSVISGSLNGQFWISVTSNLAINQTIQVSINGLICPTEILLVITPGSFDHSIINTNLSTGSADNDYKFEIQAYDEYNNNVTGLTLNNINLNIQSPNFSSLSYNVSTNPLGNLIVTVQSRQAGVYYITSTHFLNPQFYTFTINSGAPSAQNSLIGLNNSSLIAGQTLIATITLIDSYNNLIIPTESSLSLLDSELFSTTSGNSISPISINITSQNLINIYFTITDADNYILLTNIAGLRIPCELCQGITVTPNSLYLPNTVFYSQDNLNAPIVSVTNITLAYNSTVFKLSAAFLDEYNNTVQLTNADNFTAYLIGNNMVPILLNTTGDQRSIGFYLFNKDIPVFSTLVPAYSGYYIQLNHYINGIYDTTTQIPFIITGNINMSDAGNGLIDPSKTMATPQSVIMYAGETSNFTITLMTNQTKRYNGPFDLSQLQIIPSNYSNVLNITVISTQQNGIYICSIFTTTAIPYSSMTLLTIDINGTISNLQILLVVEPNLPDVTKTILLNGIPSQVLTDDMESISFSLYDTYGNLYTNSTVTNQLVGYNISGDIAFTSVVQQGDDGSIYVMYIVPSYPPKNAQINIMYNQSTNISVPIFENPIQFEVISVLIPENTDAFGTDLTGKPVDQELNFNILLRDQKLYCFDAENETVFAVFTGPYANPYINDQTLLNPGTIINVNLTANQTFLNNYITMGASNIYQMESCDTYYTVYVQPGALSLIGLYQLDIYIQNVSLTNPVVSYRSTKQISGKTDPSNAYVGITLNRGDGPVLILANDTFSFIVQMYDEYGNIITDSRTGEEVSFSISGLTLGVSYFIDAYDNYNNGTYSFTVRITEEGIYNTGTYQFIINNITVNYTQLQNQDFPEYIQVLPGRCSQTYPEIIAQSSNVPLVVGQKTTFIIACRDIFNNSLVSTSDADTFQVIIQGFNLDVVTTDTISSQITPIPNSGEYQVTFMVGWAGSYSFTVLLNNADYGTPFTLTAQYGICGTTTPYYCPSTQQCVSGFDDCEWEDVELCNDVNNPIQCLVNGTNTCVASVTQCDCPTSYSKCPADGKCVPLNSSSDLCQAIIINQCSTSYPYTCPDGSCRLNAGACPSFPTCPAGYQLCPDLQCVTDLGYCIQYPSCSSNPNSTQIYRCSDQSCASSPSSCPSRVTCPYTNQYVCPDGSCVYNSLECKQPYSCLNGLIKCSDGSCRNTLNDCPKPITCKPNFALCADGSCRESCTTITNSTNIISSRRLRLLRALQENSSINDNENTITQTAVTCPSGNQVQSIFQCPTILNCPPEAIKCPDGSCADYIDACPTQACLLGEYQCWDNKCVSDSSQCATQITCPPDQPTLCSDGSCSTSVSNCPEYISCPAYLPFRCGNGDCRKSIEECPTLITCPSQLPYICQDFSCVKAQYHCSNATCINNTIRCPDGSCAVAKSLCSTTVTCAVNQIRCWDGSCQNNTSSCTAVSPDTQVCPSISNVRCPDGSCRTRLQDCPTQLICPDDRPIRCDDGTCQQSVTLCNPNSQCTLGTVRCPDGSCVNPTVQCGTLVTCSSAAPYKCYDNTCREDPRDCPEPPTCPADSPILCGDGNCVAQRISCRQFPICSSSTPVMCPDMSCYPSSDYCTPITGCPVGTVQCNDGSCATALQNCPTLSCPVHLPYQCWNGFCVSDSEYCDDQITGCPWNKPIRCQSGVCVATQDNCQYYDSQINCTMSLCPDGSCITDSSQCYNAQGCPASAPMKCANGNCIDPTTTSCPIAVCPSTQPIKCLNGLCVSTTSSCPSSAIPDSQCGDQLVACADGTCAVTADQCKPISACPTNYYRCNDVSCRVSQSLCPLINTCPSSKPYRCIDAGICVIDQTYCPSAMNNGCPAYAPYKCSLNGACIGNQTLTALNISNPNNIDLCVLFYNTITMSNGCPYVTPYKCGDNSCAVNETSCPSNNACPTDTPYQCLDNSCASTAQACLNISLDCNSQGLIKCPDGSCQSSVNLCLTPQGCNVQTPYLCNDNTCKAAPTNIFGEYGCNSAIKCPDEKPVQCSNGECVGDGSLCSSEVPCPTNATLRCPNRQCVNDTSQCLNLIQCPEATPILCTQTGFCVSTSDECQLSVSYGTSCPPNQPILCAIGTCASVPSECSVESLIQVTSRLLQSQAVTPPDPGCNSTAPFSCYDGSCRANMTNCPIFSGCPDPSQPYLCNTGLCTASPILCPTSSICPSGYQLCTDGICRISENCPPYHGCPIGMYQCPDGYCGISAADCAGESGCPSITPFRCSNGTCVSLMSSCSRPMRTYHPEDMVLTINPLSTLTIGFIAEPDTTIKHGQITVPSGALLDDDLDPESSSDTESSSLYQALMISPVPDSIIRSYSNSIDSSRISYINQIFPLVGDTLQYQQSIRSPVVNLQSTGRPTNNGSYRFPITLQLTADIPEYSNPNQDFCLGVANNQSETWTCATRQLISIDSDNNMAFQVQQDGIYTILFNPNPNPQPSTSNQCGWFCQNIKLIILSGMVILFAIFIISYYTWRITRYMIKYNTGKKIMVEYEEQIDELIKQDTDILGQSLRDRIEGIIFVTNPLHTKQDYTKVDLTEEINELKGSIKKVNEEADKLEMENKNLLSRNELKINEIEKVKNEISLSNTTKLLT